MVELTIYYIGSERPDTYRMDETDADQLRADWKQFLKDGVPKGRTYKTDSWEDGSQQSAVRFEAVAAIKWREGNKPKMPGLM